MAWPGIYVLPRNEKVITVYLASYLVFWGYKYKDYPEFGLSPFNFYRLSYFPFLLNPIIPSFHFAFFLNLNRVPSSSLSKATIMSSNKTLLVIGSGPGIGVHTASLFVTHSFDNIALISRSQTRLSNDRETVLNAARKSGRSVNVKTWSCDIAETAQLQQVLSEVEQIGTLGCVLYNAALVVPSQMFSFGEEEIMSHFKVSYPSQIASALLSWEVLWDNRFLDNNYRPLHHRPMGHAAPPTSQP